MPGYLDHFEADPNAYSYLDNALDGGLGDLSAKDHAEVEKILAGGTSTESEHGNFLSTKAALARLVKDTTALHALAKKIHAASNNTPEEQMGKTLDDFAGRTGPRPGTSRWGVHPHGRRDSPAFASCVFMRWWFEVVTVCRLRRMLELGQTTASRQRAGLFRVGGCRCHGGQAPVAAT